MDPYQTVAAILLSACPAGSNEVRLTAELDEGWAALDTKCKDANGDEVLVKIDGINRYELHKNLDTIREEMAKQSGEKWNSCVFVVKDGKFNLKVSY